MISLGIQTCMLDMSGLVYLKETCTTSSSHMTKQVQESLFMLYRHTWLFLQAQVQCSHSCNLLICISLGVNTGLTHPMHW